jgi:RNA polymerase sigma-70 factor (ECF subfamily)
MDEKNLRRNPPADAGGTGADDLLLSLIGEGDEAALARLYKHKSRFVYSLALNILRNDNDAEEITEEVFLRIWQNAGSFDSSRGSVMAWMTTIARRLAIDRTRSKYYRGRMREVELESGSADDGGEALVGATADSVAVRAEAREVEEALNQLGESHREVIRLSYYEGMSHSMIAESLKTPLGTVKSRIREAVAQLRSILDVRV